MRINAKRPAIISPKINTCVPILLSSEAKDSEGIAPTITFNKQMDVLFNISLTKQNDTYTYTETPPTNYVLEYLGTDKAHFPDVVSLYRIGSQSGSYIPFTSDIPEVNNLYKLTFNCSKPVYPFITATLYDTSEYSHDILSLNQYYLGLYFQIPYTITQYNPVNNTTTEYTAYFIINDTYTYQSGLRIVHDFRNFPIPLSEQTISFYDDLLEQKEVTKHVSFTQQYFIGTIVSGDYYYYTDYGKYGMKPIFSDTEIPEGTEIRHITIEFDVTYTLTPFSIRTIENSTSNYNKCIQGNIITFDAPAYFDYEISNVTITDDNDPDEEFVLASNNIIKIGHGSGLVTNYLNDSSFYPLSYIRRFCLRKKTETTADILMITPTDNSSYTIVYDYHRDNNGEPIVYGEATIDFKTIDEIENITAITYTTNSYTPGTYGYPGYPFLVTQLRAEDTIRGNTDIAFLEFIKSLLNSQKHYPKFWYQNGMSNGYNSITIFNLPISIASAISYNGIYRNVDLIVAEETEQDVPPFIYTEDDYISNILTSAGVNSTDTPYKNTDNVLISVPHIE